MLTTFPESTIWSERHARSLDTAANLTFAPMAMFNGMIPAASHAATNGNATATSNAKTEGPATAAWNAAIERKVRTGLNRQSATVAVIKESPQLQADYIAEHRRQVAQRS